MAGALAALLLWRPWRRHYPKQLANVSRVVIVRIDNRVGEALLTTPLIASLSQRLQVDCVVHPKCVRVVEGLPGLNAVHAFAAPWFQPLELLSRLRELRRFVGDAVVLNAANWTTYSGTQAIVSRLIAPKSCVLGPQVGATGWLADVAIEARLDTDNEVMQRLHLGSPLQCALRPALSFRTPRASAETKQWLSTVQTPFVVVNPGGRLRERRVPLDVFAHAASVVSRLGLCPVITWGPGEREMAETVAHNCPAAQVAVATDLDGLAMLMQSSAMVVCNNTGPMHLSVAVGAKTCALFLGMPVSRWGHGLPHDMVTLDGCSSIAQMQQLVEARITAVLAR